MNPDQNHYKQCFKLPLSPVGRQMAIKNSVSNDFLSMSVDSIGVFDCCLPGVITVSKLFRSRRPRSLASHRQTDKAVS